MKNFLCLVRLQARQGEPVSQSVSHLASQLVNNTRGGGSGRGNKMLQNRPCTGKPARRACRNSRSCLQYSCYRPPLYRSHFHFHFHSGSRFPAASLVMRAGCKSSTIALIYNFCLAMQNTWAALGCHPATASCGRKSEIEAAWLTDMGEWGAWHCGASPSHVFGLAYKYFAVCLPWCA